MTKISKFLNIIMRPLDNICNLHCRYCNVQSRFCKSINFSSKSKIPAWEWLPLLIDQLNDLPELQTVVFTWHGGEPLLLPKTFFEKAVYWQREKLSKNLQWINVIQTNGLLLDSEYIDFLIDLGMHIGVSIDGPEYKHNQLRFSSPDTLKTVMDNIALLREKDERYSLFLVVHENNYQDAKEIMQFFLKMNPEEGVGLPPRFTNENSFLNPQCYRDFLIELFDVWWPDCSVHIGIFDNILRGLHGKAPSLCYVNGRCDGFITIDSQGNLHSTCELDPRLKRGNLHENPLRQILLCHSSSIIENLKKIENKTLFEILGLNNKYVYFQGKGCLNRLVKGKDPYVVALSEVIRHIDRIVPGKSASNQERRNI
jgi:uncharacterized protein